jgi:hypothetical protein
VRLLLEQTGVAKLGGCRAATLTAVAVQSVKLSRVCADELLRRDGLWRGRAGRLGRAAVERSAWSGWPSKGRGLPRGEASSALRVDGFGLHRVRRRGRKFRVRNVGRALSRGRKEKSGVRGSKRPRAWRVEELSRDRLKGCAWLIMSRRRAPVGSEIARRGFAGSEI